MSEERKIKFDVIKAISKIAAKLEDSKLKFRRTKEFSANIEKLNGYFGTTESQSWLLCAMISYYFDNGGCTVNFTNLAHFLDCPVMSIIVYQKDIEALLQKHYIKNAASIDAYKVELKNEFALNEELLNCILQNKEIELIEEEPKTFTSIDFVNKIGEIVNGRYRLEECTSAQMHMQAQKIEMQFASDPFVKATQELLPDLFLRIFFYDACSDFLSGGETDLDITILDIYDTPRRFAKANEFMNEANLLFTRDLLEFTKKETLAEASLTLTHKAKEMLLGENLKFFIKAAKGANIIEPEKIKQKELFYSPENENQIGRLKSSLVEENLVQIQNRLVEKGMPKGISVLLYGAPGTGKTESVYQIAKATGRKILHVDISASKSCWFGESEKIIKKIFTDYKDLCKLCSQEPDGKYPILLFNEADGILSKRKDSTAGNVAQTENAMQNIILEEMEKIEGIMIATTNLADNLDTAFERRFLFKIKFENPSVDAKKKIWKSKLEWLAESDLEVCAQKYDLSGGQIDNIVRKITMDEVLTGERPNLPQLEELCRSEKLGNHNNKIGFF